MATTVYRIEKDGIGMYGSGGCGGEYGYDSFRHPAPDDDAKLRKATDERKAQDGKMYFDYAPSHFGFISIEQLRAWVYADDWLRSLHESGHVLAIIRSDDVLVGHTQVIFKRPEKYLKVSIKDYFNL
jgi:hypothetical protein